MQYNKHSGDPDAPLTVKHQRLEKLKRKFKNILIEMSSITMQSTELKNIKRREVLKFTFT